MLIGLDTYKWWWFWCDCHVRTGRYFWRHSWKKSMRQHYCMRIIRNIFTIIVFIYSDFAWPTFWMQVVEFIPLKLVTRIMWLIWPSTLSCSQIHVRTNLKWESICLVALEQSKQKWYQQIAKSSNWNYYCYCIFYLFFIYFFLWAIKISNKHKKLQMTVKRWLL